MREREEGYRRRLEEEEVGGGEEEEDTSASSGEGGPAAAPGPEARGPSLASALAAAQREPFSPSALAS